MIGINNMTPEYNYHLMTLFFEENAAYAVKNFGVANVIVDKNNEEDMAEKIKEFNILEDEGYKEAIFERYFKLFEKNFKYEDYLDMQYNIYPKYTTDEIYNRIKDCTDITALKYYVRLLTIINKKYYDCNVEFNDRF